MVGRGTAAPGATAQLTQSESESESESVALSTALISTALRATVGPGDANRL